MPSFWMFTSIAMIVGSFIAGFVFFYVMSPLSKEEKKQQAEAITSLLINFVIYMWVGKILLNFSVFIKDPLAILAYPSNSHAFYLAVLFTVLHTWYKVKRHRLDVQPLINNFIYVFLFASFVYEFMQIIWAGKTHTWGYLGLLFILLIIFILVQNKMKITTLNYGVLFAWSLGQLALAYIMPFTTVYGYMMATWFLVIPFVVSIGFLLYNNRNT